MLMLYVNVYRFLFSRILYNRTTFNPITKGERNKPHEVGENRGEKTN